MRVSASALNTLRLLRAYNDSTWHFSFFFFKTYKRSLGAFELPCGQLAYDEKIKRRKENKIASWYPEMINLSFCRLPTTSGRRGMVWARPADTVIAERTRQEKRQERWNEKKTRKEDRKVSRQSRSSNAVRQRSWIRFRNFCAPLGNHSGETGQWRPRFNIECIVCLMELMPSFGRNGGSP